MTLITATKPIDARLSLPGSKSISNRALLLAALADGESTLNGFLVSDDSLAFANALKDLGVNVQVNEACLQAIVKGSARLRNGKAWCQDAGTAARFLLAACSAFEGEFILDGTARLCERPLLPLINAMRQLGANIDEDAMPCHIHGDTLAGGELSLDASDSTQFISAVLMVAPFFKQALSLKAEKLNRRAYIDLTCQMMSDFGVHSSSNGACFNVPAPQAYQAREYAIEPDLSTSSYFFAAAALTGGKIIVNNINRSGCLQGDVAFLSVLESMGCIVTQVADGVQVQGPETLSGVEVDMQNFSDPFMTLACLAPYAASATTITGLAHTRLQESDRVSAIASELNKLGITVETGPDWIRIHPGKPSAAHLATHNDHRIAMSLAILALKTPGITLDNPSCVAKTCPTFFELLAGVVGV